MNDPIRVSCSACGAVNRVPAARLADAPKCGRCKQAIFTASPIELDAEGFTRFLRDNDLPVLVDFWAPWCAPCRQMAPGFHAAAAQLEPRMRLVKVNTEDHPQLGAQFGIRSIPTLAVFAGGREIARQAGALPTSHILQFAAQAAGRGASRQA